MGKRIKIVGLGTNAESDGNDKGNTSRRRGKPLDKVIARSTKSKTKNIELVKLRIVITL